MQKVLRAIQRERIERATVKVSSGAGTAQGVLATGDFILTAAHCVEWNGDGYMALGEHYLTTIETKEGATFRLSVAAVEPVSDLAVLAAPDPEEFHTDCNAFQAWKEITEPVRVSDVKFRTGGSRLVQILSHDRGWIPGKVQRFNSLNGLIWLESDQITGGTSGGPVVDSVGELIGVVSTATAGQESCNGTMPLINEAVSRWIWTIMSKRRARRTV